MAKYNIVPALIHCLCAAIYTILLQKSALRWCPLQVHVHDRQSYTCIHTTICAMYWTNIQHPHVILGYCPLTCMYSHSASVRASNVCLWLHGYSVYVCSAVHTSVWACIWVHVHVCVCILVCVIVSVYFMYSSSSFCVCVMSEHKDVIIYVQIDLCVWTCFLFTSSNKVGGKAWKQSLVRMWRVHVPLMPPHCLHLHTLIPSHSKHPPQVVS